MYSARSAMKEIVAWIGRAAAVTGKTQGLPRSQPAEQRLRNIDADLDIGRRQQAYHRAARGDVIADDVIGVVDAAFLRRHDCALGQMPIALCQRLARRLGVRLRGANLVGTSGQVGRLHRRPELGHGRVVALQLRARVVEGRVAYEARSKQRFLALEIGGRKLPRGLRLTQLFGDGFDFRRSLPRLQVFEPRLRTTQLLLCLPSRGDLVLAFEREQRRTRGYLVAALHRELLQDTGELRPDADIFAFDIALQRPLPLRAARGKRDHAEHRRVATARSGQYYHFSGERGASIPQRQ